MVWFSSTFRWRGTLESQNRGGGYSHSWKANVLESRPRAHLSIYDLVPKIWPNDQIIFGTSTDKGVYLAQILLLNHWDTIILFYYNLFTLSSLTRIWYKLFHLAICTFVIPGDLELLLRTTSHNSCHTMGLVFFIVIVAQTNTEKPSVLI